MDLDFETRRLIAENLHRFPGIGSCAWGSPIDDMDIALGGLQCVAHLVGEVDDLHTVKGSELSDLLCLVYERAAQTHEIQRIQSQIERDEKSQAPELDGVGLTLFLDLIVLADNHNRDAGWFAAAEAKRERLSKALAANPSFQPYLWIWEQVIKRAKQGVAGASAATAATA